MFTVSVLGRINFPVPVHCSRLCSIGSVKTLLKVALYSTLKYRMEKVFLQSTRRRLRFDRRETSRVDERRDDDRRRADVSHADAASRIDRKTRKCLDSARVD